ncbi:hypothetical protein OIU79_027848 [Salix purpurea]|uniref:Uncharacterized protein n=1 Tax=Salix purpurea TaxID=77065 RepID=A0A9Q0VVV1_SALPP|nr:hypothetical protein OIU79_027848 [Salix purpurea]
MGNPWLIATATPATSSITGRHMVCSSSYYSCATSIITGSVGGSLMAAFSLVITRFFKGRFLRLFSRGFLLLAAWDAGCTPASYAPHHFRSISFLP